MLVESGDLNWSKYLDIQTSEQTFISFIPRRSLFLRPLSFSDLHSFSVLTPSKISHLLRPYFFSAQSPSSLPLFLCYFTLSVLSLLLRYLSPLSHLSPFFLVLRPHSLSPLSFLFCSSSPQSLFFSNPSPFLRNLSPFPLSLFHCSPSPFVLPLLFRPNSPSPISQLLWYLSFSTISLLLQPLYLPPLYLSLSLLYLKILTPSSSIDISTNAFSFYVSSLMLRPRTCFPL